MRAAFLSQRSERLRAEASALDATVVYKLHELQACVHDLQRERDGLHAQVVASEKGRVAAARESSELIAAVESRAVQLLEALGSLHDQERDRAALESVVLEVGLKEETHRLSAVLKEAALECSELEERLRLADSHAHEIEAERRRCKARIMTTEKENQRLCADNRLLERRAKLAGLMLADERTREKRLQEEFHLLSSALERTKALEEQQQERVEAAEREKSQQRGCETETEVTFSVQGAGSGRGAPHSLGYSLSHISCGNMLSHT
jgi:hypothetical protein